MIALLKQGKSPEDPASHRPISLLPTISKVFEKLVHKRILKVVNQRGVLPEHKFGFRGKHSTVERVSRVVATVRVVSEQKEYLLPRGLDVSQAFDRVWTTGLLHKLSDNLPKQIILLLTSYLSDRSF